MASVGFAADSSTTPFELPDRPKAYNRIKLALGLTSAALSFLLLLLLVALGYTRPLEEWSRNVAGNEYAALLVFFAALALLQSGVTLPLRFYSGFTLEHRFQLSNQTLGRWTWEHAKGLLVSLPIALAVLCALYYCLVTFAGVWWLPVAVILTLLSVVLARVAPVLILPLFYRLTPLEEGSLKERITALCLSAGLPIDGIFSFNLSKNTRKANAALAGIGRARRILLGDTLLRDFTDDETETIVAHELGHHRHRHMRNGILIGVVSTFTGLFLAAELHRLSLAWFGFSSPAEIAALPLLALWLGIYGTVTSPIAGAISRHHERQADAYAVDVTRKKDAFISALRKLAARNLADPDPHPLIEFLFYSHPSIRRRVAAVEGMVLP